MLKFLINFFVTKNFRMKPLVVITGPTGVGKTKLSLTVAEHFDSEIINADSMQVYEGLDITTNKPLPEEISRVPHHLFGFLDPDDVLLNVKTYRDIAVNKIDSLMHGHKLPVIVGGTNYYIESVLWNNLIDPEDLPESSNSNSDRDEFDPQTSYELLQKLDPEAALTIHPSNTRRIKRALQVIEQQGRKYSELLNEQHDRSGSAFRGERRYPNVCIIWLTCDLTELFSRIQARTNDMLRRGMLEEMKEFLKHKNLKSLDFERGIYQCIGIKEFYKYFSQLSSGSSCDESMLQSLLTTCTENFNIATFRYAKYQEKWIKKRFLKVDPSNSKNIFKLDTSDRNQWIDNVEKPALELIKAFMASSDLPLSPVTAAFTHSDIYERNVCNICNDQLFITRKQWLEHLNSRRHKKRMKKKMKCQDHC